MADYSYYPLKVKAEVQLIEQPRKIVLWLDLPTGGRVVFQATDPDDLSQQVYNFDHKFGTNLWHSMRPQPEDKRP